MPAVANRVMGGDVDKLFDAERVPYSIWELHRIGRWDRCVRVYRNWRPVKVPVIGGRGYCTSKAHSLGGGEGDSRRWVVAWEWRCSFRVSSRG